MIALIQLIELVLDEAEVFEFEEGTGMYKNI